MSDGPGWDEEEVVVARNTKYKLLKHTVTEGKDWRGDPREEHVLEMGIVKQPSTKAKLLPTRDEHGKWTLGARAYPSEFSSDDIESLIVSQQLNRYSEGHAIDPYERRSKPDRILTARPGTGEVIGLIEGYDLRSYDSPDPKIGRLSAMREGERIEVRVYDHKDWFVDDEFSGLFDPNLKELHFVDTSRSLDVYFTRTPEFTEWVEGQAEDQRDFDRAMLQIVPTNTDDTHAEMLEELSRITDHTGLKVTVVDLKGPWDEDKPSTNDEAYGWFESDERYQWVDNLTKEEGQSLSNYYGFGSRDMNYQLNGQPPTKRGKVRSATEEEIKEILESRKESNRNYSGWPDPVPPEGPDFNYSVAGRDSFRSITHAGEYIVQGPIVDVERQALVAESIEKLKTLIDTKGYTLEKQVVVTRGAFLAGVTEQQLMAGVGSVKTSAPFVSTFYGPSYGRLTSYATMGKIDHVYRTYIAQDSRRKHEDYMDTTEGVTVRFHIKVPAGTRVAPIESVRTRDKGVAERYERDKRHVRSEAEILLNAGTKYKVVKVRKSEKAKTSFNMEQVYDVWMELIN